MNKILDFHLKIDSNQVKDYCVKELQLNNMNIQLKTKFELDLLDFLKKSKITLSCYFDDETNNIKITPVLFNDSSIVANKNVLIEDNFIVLNDE